MGKTRKEAIEIPKLDNGRIICQSRVGLQVPRPQVPRQENKVINNIKIEVEKRLPPHRLDVSGGSKRPTRNLYLNSYT